MTRDKSGHGELTAKQQEEEGIAEAIRKGEVDTIVGRDAVAALQLENSMDCILVCDMQGAILEANRAALKKFGYSFDEMRKLSISDLHPAPARAACAHMLERLSKQGQVRLEIDFQARSGEKFIGDVSASTFIVGHETLIQSVVRDITEHKQAEETLRREQERTRQIIDTANDAFVRMDAKGRIIDWNPKAEEMFGWSREEALGKLVSQTIIPPESAKAYEKGMKRFLSTGEGPMLNRHVEASARNREGLTLPVELSIVPVYDSDTVSFNAFIRDLSAQAKAKRILKESLVGTIYAVSRAIGARDAYTTGHQQRVALLARCIADEIGLDAEQINGLKLGATIHDIGKIHLPAEILSKPSRLTATEFELIKSHSQVGYDILKDVRFPWPIADIAYQHHERLDGSGYPQGLMGEEICLEARIAAVADVVEAMSSHRPYRPALGIDVALEEIQKQRGTWLEPDAVDACLKLFREKNFSFEL